MSKSNLISIKSLPGSKSYANRALIYSHIISKKIDFKNIPSSDDVQNTISAIDKINKNVSEIYLGEGGTTIRFLLPVLCNQSKEITVRVHPRFKDRPMDYFFDLLTRLGAKINKGEDADELCSVNGPLLQDQSLEVDCSKSSQFYSALMLIQNNLNLDLSPINLNSSKAYVELTKKVISDVESFSEISIPIDFSSASYFIAWASMGEGAFFPEIKAKDNFQADSYILDIVDHSFDDGLIITPNQNKKGFKLDLSECLDLTPTLVFMSLFISNTSTFTGVQNLKYKEVDRLNGIADILSQVGADFSISDTSIVVNGGVELVKNDITPAPDHRMVMMSALIAKKLGTSVLANKDCVNKSFPSFWKLLNSI